MMPLLNGEPKDRFEVISVEEVSDHDTMLKVVVQHADTPLYLIAADADDYKEWFDALKKASEWNAEESMSYVSAYPPVVGASPPVVGASPLSMSVRCMLCGPTCARHVALCSRCSYPFAFWHRVSLRVPQASLWNTVPGLSGAIGAVRDPATGCSTFDESTRVMMPVLRCGCVDFVQVKKQDGTSRAFLSSCQEFHKSASMEEVKMDLGLAASRPVSRSAPPAVVEETKSEDAGLAGLVAGGEGGGEGEGGGGGGGGDGGAGGGGGDGGAGGGGGEEAGAGGAGGADADRGQTAPGGTGGGEANPAPAAAPDPPKEPESKVEETSGSMPEAAAEAMGKINEMAADGGGTGKKKKNKSKKNGGQGGGGGPVPGFPGTSMPPLASKGGPGPGPGPTRVPMAPSPQGGGRLPVGMMGTPHEVMMPQPPSQLFMNGSMMHNPPVGGHGVPGPAVAMGNNGPLPMRTGMHPGLPTRGGPMAWNSVSGHEWPPNRPMDPMMEPQRPRDPVPLQRANSLPDFGGLCECVYVCDVHGGTYHLLEA